jgi:hypothetical protein
MLPPGARGRHHVKSWSRQSTLADWQNAVTLALAERDPESRQRRIDLAMHAIGDQSQERKAIARALSSLADKLTTSKKYD